MRVRATTTLPLGPGAILTLTGRQASRRAHALQHLGGDRYQVTQPVQFKAGEELGVEGDLPKALADQIEGGDKPKAKGKAGQKPAALLVDPARLDIE
jgi:hypothetical protein